MSQPFVPFTAALSQSASTSATAAAAFTPVAATPAAPAHAHHGGEPRISFERDGEVIKLIRIQCSCGQTVELACAY